MQKKSFMITIDTEGDNLWEYSGGEIETKNAAFLPRFQELCDEFNFKPVYLTNYEMAKSSEFTAFAKRALEGGRCEIGMHLHAWNSPPIFKLPREEKGLPYLIEYPEKIMREKIEYMRKFLSDVFGMEPISHRAGRWAMNQKYFDILMENGCKVDCSVTPRISWKSSMGQTKNSFGPDYRKFPSEPYFVKNSEGGERILEIPVTIESRRKFIFANVRSPRNFAGETLRFFLGRPIWIRPNGSNLCDMIWLCDKVSVSNFPCLMFMLHSSELMPGGSPTFRTEESIEKLYADLRALFVHVAENFEGKTLCEFYKEFVNSQESIGM